MGFCWQGTPTRDDMAEQSEDRLSPEAFASMYIEAYPKLCAVAAREVGRSSAEDVVQQAAMLCIERLGAFEVGTDGVAWMSAFVRLTAKNHRRSTERRIRRERRGHSAGRAPDVEGTAHVQPDQAVSTSEMSHTLRNAIETLEHHSRMCLLLKVVMGHSYAEIATILDIPETTARSHAHRARKSLVERLAGVSYGEDGSRWEGARRG